MRRFAASGLTVVDFCERERVSTPSFYSWRRKLAERPVDRTGAGTQAAFQQLSINLAVSLLRIELPGGTRIEIPSDRLDLARVIVAEVARLEQGGAGNDG